MLYYKGETRDLFPKWIKQLLLRATQVLMPVVFVADAAYLLKPWLLKPYTHTAKLSKVQKEYNCRLSRAHDHKYPVCIYTYKSIYFY